MATIRELSDLNPDGTRLGQTAADLVSFHGASPCDQSATTTSVSSNGVSIGGYGFQTSGVANGIITALNAVIVCLKEKGLMASS